jgi:hypothetical protein
MYKPYGDGNDRLMLHRTFADLHLLVRFLTLHAQSRPLPHELACLF